MSDPGKRRRRDQAGQVSLFIIGLATTILLTIVTVIDASAAFLQRQALSSLAEGMALSAADLGIDLMYLQGIPDDRLEQSEVGVNRAVNHYLESSGARNKYPGLQVRTAIDRVNKEVVIYVRAPLDVPLRIPGITDGMMVGSRASAATYLLD